ncbi:AAA family ATPase [Ktedonobacteria bacterium brp13]|nr:AAA family ATPase [Ktedonobacteria bacterium brp13]
MITTNLVFSEWERIFKDPMTTMAAIDRLVHHSIILDMMSVESYRAETANQQHLPSAHPKKPSSGRVPLHETTPSLPSLDTACISSQENLDTSASENAHIDGTQSARLIATDGTGQSHLINPIQNA